MIIKESMCHCHLMWMLLQPEKFQRAVTKYHASAPDVESEGMAGYMLTNVEFEINDIAEFTELYKQKITNPSNWYHDIKHGRLVK